MTLGKGLLSGPQFPTRPSSSPCGFPPTLVLLCSHRTHACPSLLLSWAGAGMGCACSVSSGGARRPRLQASQAWLRHPVFQAQARGEGGEGREGERGEEKRGGKGGESRGRDRVAHCVCVRVCTRGGPTQCATCVPDLWGQPGLLTSGSPPKGEASSCHLGGQSLRAQSLWGQLGVFGRRLAGPLPPHAARHMTGRGGGRRPPGWATAR